MGPAGQHGQHGKQQESLLEYDELLSGHVTLPAWATAWFTEKARILPGNPEYKLRMFHRQENICMLRRSETGRPGPKNRTDPAQDNLFPDIYPETWNGLFQPN
jgi:hypothetical protein